jgi:hypothetical protein
MHTKYGRIKLITDHTGRVADQTVKDILTHLQHNKTFALTTEDDAEAMVYFPKELTARHTNGQDFVYNSPENYIDSIKLTLLAYPVFISVRQRIHNEKPVLMLNL